MRPETIKLLPCYFCFASQGVLRDFGGVRIVLCKDCAAHVQRVSPVGRAQA